MTLVETVAQAKRFEVVTCSPQEPLGIVARRMVAEDISTMVVVDDAGYLVGVLTRTDLLRALTCCEDWESHPTSEYMSKDVVTVPVHAQLFHIAQVLLDRSIHRVIVVRDEGGRSRPLAVFTSGDLVYHMVKAI
jgi:signal-transduction protein with cAMP-binding, CBS, and nucleotidyltransferase domain